MINDVRGIENNSEYITLRLNKAIYLTIYKKDVKNSLKIEYDFDSKLITQAEAKEIIDYFIAHESENIF